MRHFLAENSALLERPRGIEPSQAAFRDRFLILDDETACHIGASLKEAGKKCFGMDLVQDEGLTKMLIEKLERNWTKTGPILRTTLVVKTKQLRGFISSELRKVLGRGGRI